MEKKNAKRMFTSCNNSGSIISDLGRIIGRIFEVHLWEVNFKNLETHPFSYSNVCCTVFMTKNRLNVGILGILLVVLT